MIAGPAFSPSYPQLPQASGPAPTDSLERRGSASNPQQQDLAQLRVLAELKARDREVRAHEQAHQSVGGQYASAPSYTYQRGPDGVQYAVGGEVQIDISPVSGHPQATIDKMRTVRAAALAPAEPSGQDRTVAAEAMQLMLQAQQALARQRSASTEAGSSADSSQESEPARSYRLINELSDSGLEDLPSSFQVVA
ncbi:putative metalloprotease CJM1_0395 family protein [Marinobacter sp. SS21]|uniref:putative metalloprotease CJM1_0395 family protein n=1 Tax=Marinobacter sp. SS21 TaxID=2979460 RepID=UPI002330A514|nr:putative metalloprotease CJM1_0395 family protein [Marinobacter sp. SS21]MDC0661710.1 putative metalloprotease CJM1_0395 family protein [Marinobacter sp. SS21]